MHCGHVWEDFNETYTEKTSHLRGSEAFLIRAWNFIYKYELEAFNLEQKRDANENKTENKKINLSLLNFAQL